MNKLGTLLYSLAQKREALEQVSTTLKEFELPAEYRALQERKKALVADLDLCDATVRAEALRIYEQAGVKNPHPNVAVKTRKETIFGDEKQTREWCFTNLPKALSLDKGLIAKYAKEFGEVPGIEVTETPAVYIASDLRHLLEGNDEH